MHEPWRGAAPILAASLLSTGALAQTLQVAERPIEADSIVALYPGVAPGSCAGLASLELPGARVVSAEVVPAGAFTPPASLNPWMAADPSFYKTLPAFCRVAVKATPSADSDIAIEVWMPATAWNGRYRGQGNGGFAGESGPTGTTGPRESSRP